MNHTHYAVICKGATPSKKATEAGLLNPMRHSCTRTQARSYQGVASVALVGAAPLVHAAQSTAALRVVSHQRGTNKEKWHYVVALLGR